MRLVLRLLLGALGIALGTGAVIGLREATLSTHHPVADGSQAVLELRATTHSKEVGRTLDDMVEALLLTCRLEVGRSELVDDEPRDQGGGRYTVVFEPGLDETDQRQLRGCLEDWTVDQIRIDVLRLTVR